VVVAVEVLLVVSGCVGLLCTLAVLVRVPFLVGVTEMVMVAPAFSASPPGVQPTVPFLVFGLLVVVRVHVAWVVDTELKWTLSGRGSVTVSRWSPGRCQRR
jgi:hypothetical protein